MTEHLAHAALFLCLVAFASYRSMAVRKFLASRYAEYLVALLGAAVVLGYAAAILLYFRYPGYVQHVEPLIASISWVVGHQPLYPDPASGQFYPTAYGPVLYHANGWILHAFGPTIFTSKLLGVATFLTALVLFVAFVGKFSPPLLVLSFTAIGLAFLMPAGLFSFINRAEPFLILLATSSIAALSMPVGLGVLFLGGVAGLASGLKLHGALLTMPILFARTFEEPETGARLRVLAMFTVAFLVTLAVVFQDMATFGGYVRFLGLEAAQGISASKLVGNALYLAALFAPLVYLLLAGGSSVRPHELHLLAGLAVAALPNLIAANKPGAGLYYLAPLVPLFLYTTAEFFMARRAMIGRNGGAPLIGIVLVAALIAFFHEGSKSERSLFAIERTAAAEQAKIDELTLLLRKYPNAQVGVSDDAHYPDSWYRPLAIFNGAPLAIDFVSWMDFAFAGKPSDAIAWAVSGCTIPIWILPAGEAFSIANWYTATRLLPTNFRDAFYANYRQVDSSATYSVWRCGSP